MCVLCVASPQNSKSLNERGCHLDSTTGTHIPNSPLSLAGRVYRVEPRWSADRLIRTVAVFCPAPGFERCMEGGGMQKIFDCTPGPLCYLIPEPSLLVVVCSALIQQSNNCSLHCSHTLFRTLPCDDSRYPSYISRHRIPLTSLTGKTHITSLEPTNTSKPDDPRPKPTDNITIQTV